MKHVNQVINKMTTENLMHLVDNIRDDLINELSNKTKYRKMIEEMLEAEHELTVRSGEIKLTHCDGAKYG